MSSPLAASGSSVSRLLHGLRCRRTLSPGESATVHVEATGVSKVQFNHPRKPTSVEFAFDEADFDSSPTLVLESDPPIWVWGSEQQSVTVDVPIHVGTKATLGTYHYSVTGWKDSDRTNRVTAEVTVTIEA